ncbi:FMN-binding negative transcriptional regulator [Rhizosaccharibacter radicis]|uniref:FMN-binding negative transcriptional regulator n=1 Tax=Rhizosaccharibacter radicis TaxID=2782605 RepID=A0ABT1W0G2_9PROT|nr:FMN-binding negative transcriptional regulator [Acetobacteraceae bacterium KSS12]
MFIPDEYRLSDAAQALALAREIRTGSLLVCDDSGVPDASHLPFLFDADGADPVTGAGAVLTGHVDRRNPQWRALRARPDCRVAFLSPQAHVSPSWYGTRPRAPTWLYVAIHVRGRATLVEDGSSLRRMVERLSTELEPGHSPWNVDQIVPYTERLMNHIVGFTVAVDRVDAQIRLGQTNTPDDRRRVLAGLDAGDAQARAVAGLIRRLAPFDGG